MQRKSAVISLFTPHDAGRIQFRMQPVDILRMFNGHNTELLLLTENWISFGSLSAKPILFQKELCYCISHQTKFILR